MESTVQSPSIFYGFTAAELNHYVLVGNLVPHVREMHLFQFFREFNPTIVAFVPWMERKAAFVAFNTPQQVANVLEDGIILRFWLFGKRLEIYPLYSAYCLRMIFPQIQIPELLPIPMNMLDASIIRVITKRTVPELPRECVTVIAGYVGYHDRASMEMVSRIWRLGSMDSHYKTTILDVNDRLWGKRSDMPKVTNKMIGWLLKRCGSKLITINIDDTPDTESPSELIEMIVEYCPNVENLFIDGIKLEPDAIMQIANKINRLRNLAMRPWDEDICTSEQETALSTLLLNNTLLKSLKITGENCHLTNCGSIGGHLLNLTKTLRHLEVNNCAIINEVLLGTALRHLRQLESLKVTKCIADNTELLWALIENDALHSTLKSLRFHVCNFYYHPTEILGIMIVQSYKNLTTFQVSSCAWITGETIQEIAANMTQLEILDISACHRIRGEFALDPLAHITTLKSLAMSVLSAEVGARFLKFMTLRHLECISNSGVTDENICDLLWNVDSIEYINVSDCSKLTERVVNTLYQLRTTPRENPLDIYLYRIDSIRKKDDVLDSKIRIHYEAKSGPDYYDSEYADILGTYSNKVRPRRSLSYYDLSRRRDDSDYYENFGYFGGIFFRRY